MKNDFKTAVLDYLAVPGPVSAAALLHYRSTHWQRLYRWLDESGLALYLADSLQREGWFAALPEQVQARFVTNLTDSRQRADALLREHVRLMEAFAALNSRFVVQKGLAFVPEYCPDPALRTQCDIDLQVPAGDAPRFVAALHALGYQGVKNSDGMTDDGELIFETHPGYLHRREELYQPRKSYRVELHFAREGRNTRSLEASQTVEPKMVDGVTIPVLPPVERFLHQAAHVASHLGGGYVRLSWMYEIATFIRNSIADRAFWAEVIQRCAEDQQMCDDLGWTLRFIACSFGLPDHRDLQALMPPLSAESMLWLERFGREFLVADFPGSKLHLLLEGAFWHTAQSLPASRARRLFPLKKAMYVVGAAATVLMRTRNINAVVVRYSGIRLLFHLRESCRYFAARRRWRRAVQALRAREAT